MRDQKLIQTHLQAHELGLHTDNHFHAECDICLDNATDRYATECLDILREYGANDDALANLLSYVIHDMQFDRDKNGRTGIFLHEGPLYTVARFLKLKFQGDGIHTSSSRAFKRLEQIASRHNSGY